MAEKMNLGQDRGRKEMIRGVQHIAKWNYIRAALAFRRAVKLAPDVIIAEIRRTGAEGDLRNVSKMHSSFAIVHDKATVAYSYDMFIGHKIKSLVARKAADLFAKKDEETV